MKSRLQGVANVSYRAYNQTIFQRLIVLFRSVSRWFWGGCGGPLGWWFLSEKRSRACASPPTARPPGVPYFASSVACSWARSMLPWSTWARNLWTMQKLCRECIVFVTRHATSGGFLFDRPMRREWDYYAGSLFGVQGSYLQWSEFEAFYRIAAPIRGYPFTSILGCFALKKTIGGKHSIVGHCEVESAKAERTHTGERVSK